MTEQPPETGIIVYDFLPPIHFDLDLFVFPKTKTQDTHQEACGIHD